MSQFLSVRLFLVVILFPMAFFLLSVRVNAEVPPLFEGELAVCKNVDGAMVGGEDLRDALISNIEGLQSNDPELRSSIRRTFIHNAILICNYDESTVIEAAYLAGLPIELLTGSSMGAGVEDSVIMSALLKVGADPKLMIGAMEIARSPVSVDLTLPPAIDIGSGLGPASQSSLSP